MAGKLIRRIKIMKFKISMLRCALILILCLTAPGAARAGFTTDTDLTIGKSTSLTSALVGNTVVFTIGITNLGLNTANNITGSDVVPSGFSIFAWNSSGSPSAPVYNPTNGLWTLASIAPGVAASLIISTIATNAGIYTNTALITGASIPDPNTNNNAASVVVTLATQPADLKVTKTAGLYEGGTASQFQVGDSVTFTITISNLGPGIPFNITGSDVVPAGFSVSGWSSSGPGSAPDYNPGTGVWTLGSLYPGNSAVLLIFATATSGGTFTNTVSITGASVSDPNPANNSSGVVVTVAQPRVDLQVTKTVGTNSVFVGGLVPFTITITNLGPNSASNITVLEVLPPGLSFSSAGVPGITSFNPNNGVWTIPSLAVGNGFALALSALATNAGTFTNNASLTGSTPPDTNAANNSASAVVTATVQLLPADLKIAKTANPTNLLTGQQVVFTVSLQNLGPNNVTNSIVVTDCLPPGFQYVTDSTVGGGGIGTYSPGTCAWTLVGLGNTATVFLNITALATNTGAFTNTATVAVPQGYTDPNLTNNTASAVVIVTNRVADLAVTKTVFTNSLPVFSTFAFNFFLTVTNLGPDTVSNLTLTDLLPAGLSFGGAINSPGSSYTASNGLWSFSVPLAAGQGATMTLVTAAPQIPGTFTNTLKVNVPSTVTDPNTNNNSASVVVKVLPVYRILGYVANCSSNGVPLANVTVRLSGAANQTTTTFGIGNGNYSFDTVSNGVYTVTPSQPGNVFTPASAVVTVSNAWVTVPAFVGSIGLIYGQVSYFGNPVTNHPVTLAGGVVLPRPGPPRTNTMVLTDANGYYIFTNIPAGNYTVTAVATNGYRFNPTNAAITLDATNCAAFTNFVAVNRRGVQLVALEVVQVIQDWSNSVRLIQSKETYVRSHLQLTNNNPVLLQGARLYGTGSGGPLAGSPLSPLNAGGALLVRTTNAADRPIRGNLANSLNFRLPADWLSGAISLRFECTNNITVVPTNVVPPNSTVPATFVPSSILQVKFVGYNWTNAGVYQRLDLPAFADLPRRLLSIYPVPDATLAKLINVPPTILPVPTTIPPAIAATEGPGDWALLNANARLNAQKFLDGLISRIFGGGRWIYYGSLAWPSPDTLGWAGAFVTSSNTIGTTSFVSSGFVNPTFYPMPNGVGRHVSNHEIGHNLGRPHDIYSVTGRGVCNEGGGTVFYPLFQPVSGGAIKPTLGPMTNGVNSLIYGLDTLTLKSAPAQNPVVDPNVFFDLMSYCRVGPLDRWISKFTYNAMFDAITNSFAAAPPPGGPPGPALRWQLFRGFLDGGAETGGLLPVLTVTTTNVPPTPPAGDYFIQLYDANTNLVTEIPFDPDAYIIDEDSPTTTSVAQFLVPVIEDPSVRQVVLWHATTMLAKKVASANAPVVSAITLSDTNGATFTGSGLLVINWLGSDTDGDALTYTVQYSADSGATWETMLVDWPYASCVLDSAYLTATTHGQIRVVASDGFNNSADAGSSTFTVVGHRPAVSINAPLNGSIFIGDQEIFLDAFANDPQDGLLDGASVTWTSSLDGTLASGAVLNFEATTLTEGTHDVMVTATDSLGLTNSASVRIYVLRNPPPQLDIQLVGNAIAISWPSSVTNYALESTLNLLPASWTAVTNVPAAADAQQTVTLNVSASSRFFRLRMTP